MMMVVVVMVVDNGDGEVSRCCCYCVRTSNKRVRRRCYGLSNVPYVHVRCKVGIYVLCVASLMPPGESLLASPLLLSSLRLRSVVFHLLVSVILRYLARLGLYPPVKHFSTTYLKVQVPTYESNTGAYAAMPLLLNSPTTDLVSDLLLIKNNASASLSRYT